MAGGSATGVIQARLLQCGLHRFDDVRQPGVLRVAVVHRDERSVDVGDARGDRFVGRLQDLGLAHPRSKERDLDLGVVEGRRCLRHAAHALAPHPNQPLDRHRVRPGLEDDLHHGDKVERFLVDRILRLRTGESHGLPNDLQQLQAEPGISAELPVGLPHEPAVPVPAREIQELEGKVSVSDGSRHPLERQSTCLEAVNQAYPSHIAHGEEVARINPGQDPEIDQSIDIADMDPCSLRQCLARESAHDPHMVVAARIQADAGHSIDPGYSYGVALELEDVALSPGECRFGVSP
jgi:hypothetical protein